MTNCQICDQLLNMRPIVKYATTNCLIRNEEDERRAVCGSDDDDLGPQVPDLVLTFTFKL